MKVKISDEVQAIMAALSSPFPTEDIKFKPQVISGNRALAVPYVDARAIGDKLDTVLGIANWQDAYEVLTHGEVVCRLSLRIEGEWITKEDVGGQSEQPDSGDRLKSAFSDAFKRAAGKWGVGRFLYRYQPEWLDYDSQKKRFNNAVFNPARLRQHATPRQSVAQSVGNSPVSPQPTQTTSATQATPVKQAARVKSVGDFVAHLDQRLLQDGVISSPGELAGWVMDTFRGKHKGPISSWPVEAYEEIKRACLDRANSLAEATQNVPVNS